MRRLAVAALAAAGLALTACGDDDAEKEALSAPQLRAEVSRMCRADTKAAKKFAEPTVTDKEYARQLEGLLGINAKSRERFEEIEPPEELRDAYQDFLAANDEGVELTRDIVERLEKGEKRKKIFRGRTAERVVEIGRARTDAVKRLGTPDCGSGV